MLFLILDLKKVLGIMWCINQQEKKMYSWTSTDTHARKLKSNWPDKM